MAHAFPCDLLALALPSGVTAWDRATGTQASAADLADALAALKPRRGARVVVVSSSLFTQHVRLDAVRTAALDSGELEGALFYEVEPFCGVPREAAVLAADRLAAGEWRVTVADRAELAALRDRAAAARCRFAGAAALPPGLSATDPAAVAAALFPGDAPPTSLLQPPRGGIPPRALAILSAAVSAAILLLFAADALWLDARTRRLRPDLAESEALSAAVARTRQAMQTDLAAVRAIETARARREAALAALAAGRDRWPALLSALADAAGDAVVIRSIDAEDGGSSGAPASALVRGLAATPADAAAAMARLAGALRPSGWQLQPGTVEERPGAAAAAFAFRAVPVPLPEDP